MIKEGNKTITCPKCGSSNVIRVHPFDYVKQCENKKCSYYLNSHKKWKYQFATGGHN